MTVDFNIVREENYFSVIIVLIVFLGSVWLRRCGGGAPTEVIIGLVEPWEVGALSFIEIMTFFNYSKY